MIESAPAQSSPKFSKKAKVSFLSNLRWKAKIVLVLLSGRRFSKKAVLIAGANFSFFECPEWLSQDI